MFNFFAKNENRQGERFLISGSDFNHIKNVLRMREGDEFLVSCGGESHLCRLEKFFECELSALIIEENYQNTDLPIKIVLFQGLPKSDKMELIIQKAVELGVHAIVPTEMARCVVKLDDKKKKSKKERWQAIAESAAKQSKRSEIPEVCDVLSYDEALKKAAELDLFLVPYESKNGMLDTKEALLQIKSGTSVGVLIGAEGGFDDAEIKKAESAGGRIISLGKRILRTETAAIAAAAMCMLYAEMNLNEENK
ncbi:MAG: 16S rRNA (uracil(1498)-N(3))-methyltransferase [Oscillospiraceae bacterium]|nr:16S rRNA (uracil(1498)-N(3))-methyltransferase [Oscillospiraceae bacterium]MBQ5816549.1 16S rRNA (uracil(1498)-N(3))-methyltransferase [Oscillospiraceae bacterium]